VKSAFGEVCGMRRLRVLRWLENTRAREIIKYSSAVEFEKEGG
jgi:hypothetical protein